MYVIARVEYIDRSISNLFAVVTLNMMILKSVTQSSETPKEPICDSVTPSCLPQHDSSTPCKDSVVITTVIVILTPPTDESVITYIQLSGVHGVDIQSHVVDIRVKSKEESFGVDDFDLNLNKPEPIIGKGINTTYKTEYDVQSSKDVGTNDDDNDLDEDFLVDEENEIVKPDVDVHLFGISMDLPFENIGFTNLVSDDVLEGEEVDVINADGFNSDPGNDEEKNYRKRRVYLHSIESRRNLKLYKNDGVRISARCDGKVHVFTMSQGTGPTGLNRGMNAGPSGSTGPTTRSSKKRKNIGTNDDSQASSSILDAHDKGDLMTQDNVYL
ncbi:hypothetical protein Tco_0418512 [Tanacetum coccineum]